MNILLNEIFSKKIAGEGPLNFVLIHNVGGSHKMFSHQVEMLLRHGSVVLLDLPGHGSSVPRNQNSINHSSDIIEEICKYYVLDNVWLVGLNNGASIAINIDHMQHLTLSGMILIDPPLFMNPQLRSSLETFISSIDPKSYESYTEGLVSDLLANTNKAEKIIAHKECRRADLDSLKQAYRSLLDWDYDAKGVVSSISIPTLCILTDGELCSYDIVKQAAPQFIFGKVVGSKCWATLDAPEQVNAMIERFLAVNNKPKFE
jgi:pimeloyl-ACP methyl ester carboxylesterase